jgi:hypothetical protein
LVLLSFRWILIWIEVITYLFNYFFYTSAAWFIISLRKLLRCLKGRMKRDHLIGTCNVTTSTWLIIHKCIHWNGLYVTVLMSNVSCTTLIQLLHNSINFFWRSTIEFVFLRVRVVQKLCESCEINITYPSFC